MQSSCVLWARSMPTGRHELSKASTLVAVCIEGCNWTSVDHCGPHGGKSTC
jgi:hypothetical protein